MVDNEEKWIVQALNVGAGQLMLRLSERHEVGSPGKMIDRYLNLSEIEDLNIATTKALWYAVHNFR